MPETPNTNRAMILTVMVMAIVSLSLILLPPMLDEEPWSQPGDEARLIGHQPLSAGSTGSAVAASGHELGGVMLAGITGAEAFGLQETRQSVRITSGGRFCDRVIPGHINRNATQPKARHPAR